MGLLWASPAPPSSSTMLKNVRRPSHLNKSVYILIANFFTLSINLAIWNGSRNDRGKSLNFHFLPNPHCNPASQSWSFPETRMTTFSGHLWRSRAAFHINSTTTKTSLALAFVAATNQLKLILIQLKLKLKLLLHKTIEIETTWLELVMTKTIYLELHQQWQGTAVEAFMPDPRLLIVPEPWHPTEVDVFRQASNNSKTINTWMTFFKKIQGTQWLQSPHTARCTIGGCVLHPAGSSVDSDPSASAASDIMIDWLIVWLIDGWTDWWLN